MMYIHHALTELTLDPDSWSDLRALGHRMLDDMFQYLETVRERPVWKPVPADVRARLQSPLPTAERPASAVYDDFRELILPYPTGNIHPRFWGWVMGTGSPLAMLADMLASGMNSHVAGYDQSASLVEDQVLRWFAELLGFPETTSGILTSGGTVANLIALTVARNIRAGYDVRKRGVQQGLVVYCSTETHSWAQKGVELLGLGSESLRKIAVDENFEIRLHDLHRAIESDRNAGRTPICVIGTAGTVNTGATDDLRALAKICAEEKLWFHVDGAFGALARLAPKHRAIADGIELADSIAFDLHKWMYMPFEAGCVLIRDAEAHRSVFALTPSYLTALDRGIAAKPLEFAARGIDLSRGFKALKIWFSLKVHGVDLFGQLIDQNIEQAAYLRERIERENALELMAPVPLNVVCFRYRASDAINQEIVLRLQESGVAVPSSTMIDGRFAIRVANTNHRSRREDFDLLIDEVLRIGRELEEAR